MTLIADSKAFAAHIPPAARLMGLDHGAKTIGIALSDAGRTLAAPHSTIQRGKLATDLAALKALCEHEKVGGIVIGYPLNMDGSEGPRCQSVRAFVRNLESAIDLPVLLADERMSTHEAHEALKGSGRNYSQRQGRKDQAAAALILQSILDILGKSQGA